MTKNKKTIIFAFIIGLALVFSFSACKEDEPIPDTPLGLLVTPASSSSIDVTWTSSFGATEYSVYRSTSESGTYTEVKSVSAPVSVAVSYNDTGLASFTRYYYKVSAKNRYGESAQTGSVSALTFPGISGIPYNPVGIVDLTAGTWFDYHFYINENAHWYRINVTAGQTYYIWCQDSDSGSTYYDFNAKVDAFYDGGTNIFYGADNTYTTPKSFNATTTGIVYIAVYARNYIDFGDYRIAYNTTNTRP